jgi:tRNA A37 threonylcarbamoyladenosine dehydratase
MAEVEEKEILEDKFTRSRMIFGDDFSKLQSAKILLLGVGGVGSYCLDCLLRSGVTDITIVDYDSYDVTNQNRQLHSEHHEGENKVEALSSHYSSVIAINQKIDKEWIETFDFEPYDLILDAIDDIHAKLALAQKCYKKLISAVGSAKRLDPTKIEVATIYKTHGDRFGAKIRYELKKRRFNKKYPVIFSSEPAVIKEEGSFMAVTAAFGLTMCSQAIMKLQKK